MNASFPGNPRGSVTERVCNIIENILMPECDFVVDIHSGGRSLEYIPAPLVALSKDSQLNEEALSLAESFNTPYIYIIEDAGSSCTAAAAHRKNKPIVATEIGGGELSDAKAIQIAYDGIVNILAKKKIIESQESKSNNAPIKLLFNSQAFLRAPTDGFFVPEHQLGEKVQKGELAGYMLWPNEPDRPAQQLFYPENGVLVCRRTINRTRKGDCVLHLGIPK